MNKKEAILLAALHLITKKGVHNTPMSAIAKAANTGMGTIYNYFPNKEKLINELYINIKKKEKEIYATFEPNRPIKTQFEDYFISTINFFTSNPLYFKFMEQLHASPIITEQSRNEGYKSVDTVLQLLIKGKEERIIKDIDINELFTFIGGAVLSCLRWYFSQTATSDISIKSQSQMVWDGIKE
ncbi:TetR/AcrR family transcriptional regulator [Aquimarina algicola]|uniref:TetR/AcrR family transcriptional regulator n=1 Tax=Aquimarina algicola TaxID=2589995 RepID=A0A504J8I2_9FLAO|nr:TetR/AcrR family transcriptional regulator [Aquimarina algicola]TPN82990.1 TetR/AcrR family transcriptional regulator [Aquimarina algicola]